MQRTKVYFLFGDHGPIDKRPDPDFFRREMGRIINEDIIGKGGKISILDECMPDWQMSRKVKPIYKNFLELHRQGEVYPYLIASHIADIFIAQVRQGQIVFEGGVDWDSGELGYERMVRDLNKKGVCEIKTINEPSAPGPLLADMHTEFIEMFGSSPFGTRGEAFLKERVSAFCLAIYMRDVEVLRLMQKVLEDEPGVPIVVTRGFDHYAMAGHAYEYLRRDLVEVVTKREEDPSIHSSFEAIAMLALDDLWAGLGNERLGEYTSFWMACGRHLRNLKKEASRNPDCRYTNDPDALEALAVLHAFEDWLCEKEAEDEFRRLILGE